MIWNTLIMFHIDSRDTRRKIVRKIFVAIAEFTANWATCPAYSSQSLSSEPGNYFGTNSATRLLSPRSRLSDVSLLINNPYSTNVMCILSGSSATSDTLSGFIKSTLKVTLLSENSLRLTVKSKKSYGAEYAEPRSSSTTIKLAKSISLSRRVALFVEDDRDTQPKISAKSML